jgi:hypothetical protein
MLSVPVKLNFLSKSLKPMAFGEAAIRFHMS